MVSSSASPEVAPSRMQGRDLSPGWPDEPARKAVVALVDSRPVTRLALSCWLAREIGGQRHDDYSVRSFVDIEDVAHEFPGSLEPGELLLLMSVGDSGSPVADSMAQLVAFRERFPSQPVVIICDSHAPSLVWKLLNAGVQGVIPSNANTQMVVSAIRLALSGGFFLPPDFFQGGGLDVGVLPGQLNPEGNPASVPGLTGRENEVFRLLKEGRSNKYIAFDLGMHESTVKVHVRHIMRKLKAVNRTHAVFLANSGRSGQQ